jgi:plasmid stabilization system protein ParE
MSYKLIVKEEAVNDLQAAFDWYESKQVGLGTKFLDEVEIYYHRITTMPFQYQLHDSKIVAVLRRFPYKIVYELAEETIVVYAIFHTRRNLKELSRR